MRKKKFVDRNILAGKGQEWSAVAAEFDGIFYHWLVASQLSEKDFLCAIERDEMYLTFFADDKMALTIFHHKYGEIGMPLVWQWESGISFESYMTDTALLLLYIAGKCQRQETKDKIERFVKTELLKR